MEKNFFEEVHRLNKHVGGLARNIAEANPGKEAELEKWKNQVGFLVNDLPGLLETYMTERDQGIGEKIIDVLNLVFGDRWPIKYLEIENRQVRHINVDGSRFVWDEDKKKLTGDYEEIRRLENENSSSEEI